MFKNQRLKYVLPFILSLIMLGIKLTLASDDDDDDDGVVGLIAELLFDLGVGMCVGICQKNPTCRAWLGLVALIIVLVTLIGWCADDCKSDCCTARDIRRGATVWAGSKLA